MLPCRTADDLDAATAGDEVTRSSTRSAQASLAALGDQTTERAYPRLAGLALVLAAATFPV
jgi:hypothetical protein